MEENENKDDEARRGAAAIGAPFWMAREWILRAEGSLPA
jgi:hypothetical protein